MIIIFAVVKLTQNTNPKIVIFSNFFFFLTTKIFLFEIFVEHEKYMICVIFMSKQADKTKRSLF